MQEDQVIEQDKGIMAAVGTIVTEAIAAGMLSNTKDIIEFIAETKKALES